MPYKTSVLFILILISFYAFAQTVKIPKNAVKGDFDGDGKPEYAWVVKAKIKSPEEDCTEGKCVIKIMFSKPVMQPIYLQSSYDGELYNVGDLNGDGSDEFAAFPEWFTGCGRFCYIYTQKNNEWTYLIPPISSDCNDRESSSYKAIEKVPGKPGWLKVRYHLVGSNQYIVKTVNLNDSIAVKKLPFDRRAQKLITDCTLLNQ